jgi:cytoskeletal protein RodZ
MIGVSNENTSEEMQTLGTFLRSHREQKGVSIEDVCESTKISKPMLIAMEEDNYERLPAAAFSRGFYSLYAEFLELDAKNILERLNQTKGHIQKTSKKLPAPPILKSQGQINYAESPFFSPAAGKSIISIVCLAAIIGICWYFNWNPVDYISNKLIPQTQDITQSQETTETEEIAVEETVTETKTPITTGQSQADTQVGVLTVGPYNLEIDFYTDGILKVTLDDGFVLDKHFTAGKTLQWQVKKKIILDMPETIQGIFRLNGIKIPLPKAENGRRRLSLPEDLLD